MDVRTKADLKAEVAEGVRSSEVINAERYIIAGDDGKHYLLALSDGKPLYFYLISYDLTRYEVLGKADVVCPKCGGPLVKFHVYRDIYGECDKGHLNHIGVIVAWRKPGGESEG